MPTAPTTTRRPTAPPARKVDVIRFVPAPFPFWRVAAVSAVLAVGIIGAAVTTAGLLHGCAPAAPVVRADPRPDMITAGPLVQKNAEGIGHQADVIDDAGERYMALLAPAQRLVWQPYKATINAATSAQREAVGQLKTVPPAIAKAVKQTTVLIDDSAAKDVKIADLQAKLDARGQLWLTLLIVGGCIGVALGIADVVEGNLTGGITIVTFSAALAVVATIFRDHEHLVIGVAVVLLVGGGIYAVAKRIKAGSAAAAATAAANKANSLAAAAAADTGTANSLASTALDSLADAKSAAAAAELKLKVFATDTTQFMEWVKQEVAAHLPASFVKLFGDGVTPGVADHVQTPSTRAIVKATRASGTVKLANLDKPTPVPAVTLTATPAALPTSTGAA